MIDATNLGNSFENFINEQSEENLAMNVIKIHIDSLQSDPNQPRKDFNQEELDKLAEDIKDNGLLQPIIVYPSETNGQYIIIAGERRYRACKQAQIERVDCIVRSDFENKSHTDIAKLQMAENVKRDNLKFWEISEYIINRLNNNDEFINQDELAKELGLRPAQISKYKSWSNAPEFLKEAARSGQINTITKFYELLFVKTPEELSEVLTNTDSAKQIKEWKKNHNKENEASNDEQSHNEHHEFEASNDEQSHNEHYEFEASNDEQPHNEHYEFEASNDEQPHNEHHEFEASNDEQPHNEHHEFEASNDEQPHNEHYEFEASNDELRISLGNRTGKILTGEIVVLWDDGTEELLTK